MKLVIDLSEHDARELSEFMLNASEQGRNLSTYLPHRSHIPIDDTESRTHRMLFNVARQTNRQMSPVKSVAP